MTESVVPLGKEIKDSLTRQGMQNIKGPLQERTGRKGKKGMSTFL